MAKMEVRSELQGILWQIAVVPGQQVAEGDELVVLESMKMEIPIYAPKNGEVVSIEFEENMEVAEGDVVAILDVDDQTGGVQK